MPHWPTHEPTITPPWKRHCAALGGGAACAMTVCAVVAWAMGAGPAAIQAGALVIAGATLLTAWPAIVRSPQPVLRWGFLVMAGTSARLMAVVILAAIMPHEGSAYWIGILAGALTQLMIETGVLISVIAASKPAIRAQVEGIAHD